VIYKMSIGYTTSGGDGDTESVEFFDSRTEALAAAREVVPNLRVVTRDGSSRTDEVMVEEVDEDGEPINQPILWVRGNGEVIS
jgi:hypothetical protein